MTPNSNEQRYVMVEISKGGDTWRAVYDTRLQVSHLLFKTPPLSDAFLRKHEYKKKEISND